MSIIYSYPTTQPTVDDLLIGTDVGDDNATKSFTVQSLVSLINAESGSGTLTGVTIFTDAFITAIGNPTGPAVAYTIGLSATGTPSATTFLRGDNQWVVPTVSAGIGVYQNNIVKTLDVSSFNFTGDGVNSVTSSQNGEVNINIPGAISAIESINAGTGVTVSPTTGNVVITNAGVIGIVDGFGITTTNSNGTITINADVQSTTGLVRIDAGAGLVISAGSPTSDPTMALNYTGVGNFINAGIDNDAAVANDSILFQQTSSGDVKSTTFGEIQASTLELIDESITTANANVIVNEDSTPPSQSFSSVSPVQRVVTLLDSEYNTLITNGTTLGNTLYLTTSTVVPQVTKTLSSITATVSGGSQGTAWQYNNSFDTVGSTRTGAQGGSYAFDTRITALNGYTFTSGPVYNNASGTLDVDGNVSSSLTATMAPPPTPGTCTFQINYDVSNLTLASGISGSDYSIIATGGSVVNGNQLQGTCPYTVGSMEAGFAVQVVINDTAQYEFIGTPSYTYSPQSGTSTAATSPVPVTCAINATIARKNITLTYITTDSNSGGGVITSDYQINNITTSGPTFTTNSSPNVGTSTIVAPYNSVYSISSSVNNLSTTTSTTGSGSLANPITGTMTTNATVTNDFTTTTTSNNNTVTPKVIAVLSGNSPIGSYNVVYNYRESGTSTWLNASGGSATQPYPVGTVVEFSIAVLSINPYFFSSGPTGLYNGQSINVSDGLSAFTTVTVAGGPASTPMPFTPSVSFEMSEARVSFARSSQYGSANDACGKSKGNTSYLQKASGNTSSYAELNDIVYTSATGSTLLSDGYYASTINNGTTNAYIYVQSGQINIADGCL